MNIQQLLQHCLLAASLVGAAVCLAAVLAHHFRNQLRTLHERWLGLGPLGRVASILAVTVAVLYGGTKSPTNDGQDARRPIATSSHPANQLTNQLTNWTARGAYSDWQRIGFPPSFDFPYGTNLLTSVTLFAWGEIREALHQPPTINQQLTTQLVMRRKSRRYCLCCRDVRCRRMSAGGG